VASGRLRFMVVGATGLHLTVVTPNAKLPMELKNLVSPILLAIGTATLYVQGNRVVGFYDPYDFDPKSWFGSGSRTFRAELGTGAANALAPSTSANLKICYGTTPASTDCQ
jgi:hypothetical protein